MEILVKILQFVLSFSLLITIHELGHFMFARMFGIRVDKFYLFFNPGFSLFKKKIGDTEYGIGWIPFGGYVKIAGMIDESMDTEQLKQPPQPDEFRSKPAWQRLLVMLGGVIMNVVLAMVIYIGITWYYGDRYIANEDVRFGWTFNELGHEIGFRNGDRILTVGGRPVENALAVFPEIALNTAAEVRVLRQGSEVTVKVPESAVARVLQSSDFMEWRIPFVVGAVQEGGGAMRAGVMEGDSLVGIDGTAMAFFDEYLDYVSARAGQTVDLELIRPGEGVEPRTLQVEISGEGRMGISPYALTRYVPVQSRKYSLVESIPAGIKRTGSEITSYGKQMKLIFTPKTEAYKSLGGPIAIFNVFPNFWSWEVFWKLSAFLSLILAVMNILPIPGLDGGHVMFTLYEIVARRKPGDKFMEYATFFGLIFLFSLMLLVTGNDIYKAFFK